MDRELKALLDRENKERKVDLGLNCNCEGCENGEFEIVDIYDSNISGLSEDSIIVYHGTNKDEAMVAITRYARNAEQFV